MLHSSPVFTTINVCCSKSFKGWHHYSGLQGNKFIGLSGIMLLTWINKSVVKWYEFAIASTSISKVCNDLSYRLVPWVFNKEVKIVLALLIYLSHTPPILLAEGGFHFHSIHSPPLNEIKCLSWNHWSFVGPFLQKLSEIQKLQQSYCHYVIWCFNCNQ